MKFTEKHIEWFDDFLSGKLDQKSQIDFERLLLEDEAFCDEFESYKSFCEEIKESFQNQLFSDVKKGEEKYFHKIKIRKYIFLSLAAICILGILGIFLVNPSKKSTPLPEEIQKENDAVFNDASSKSEDSVSTNVSNIENLQEASNTSKKLEKNNSSSNKKIIEIKQITHQLLPFNTLELTQSGDTVIIKSNKEIKDFLSFEKNKKSYLKVGETLYYQTKEGFYLIEKDARIAEIAASASGKGKSKTIKLMLFEEKLEEKNVEQEADTETEIYYLKDLKVSKSDFERFKANKVFQIPTKVFTIEDLYNLESN